MMRLFDRQKTGTFALKNFYTSQWSPGDVIVPRKMLYAKVPVF